MNNEYNETIKKTLVIVINIVTTMYPNRLELIINKKIRAKKLGYMLHSVKKSQYVGNLTQNCSLHNNNRISGNKIVLSIGA